MEHSVNADDRAGCQAAASKAGVQLLQMHWGQRAQLYAADAGYQMGSDDLLMSD